MKGHTKLKALLSERSIRQQEIADLLGISRPRLNEKLNGITGFSMTQGRIIARYLGVSMDIFFED